MSDCDVAGDNHSDDVLTIWYGRPTPLIRCGFHYQALGVKQ